MPLRAERRPDLPPLAWLLDLTGDEAVLISGDSVEIRDDRFFEGAWAGTFAEAAIENCRDVFGSGGLSTPSGWLLVPPSHPLEYLVCLRGPGGWVASNSPAFLHAWTNMRFELPSRRLASIFIRIINGIDQSPISAETTAGTLLALFHHNLLLRADGFDLRPKPLPSGFSDYTSYVEHLRQTISLVAANAAAPGRRRPYRLLATCSSGYDSPACAALARRSGCEEVITFDVGRSGAPDEGSLIAECLGMRTSRIARPLHTHDLGDAELEFLSTGMHGEDVIFAAASRHLEGRALLTGFHGSGMWDVDIDVEATDGLSSRDASGRSMAEFRLARDFVHVPVPFIGAQRLSDVAAITHTPEMEPYTLRNWYDKPIARRIVEEAGVPRELFGQSKQAVSMRVFVFSEQLSPATRQAVRARVAAFGARDRLAYRVQRLWFRAGMRSYALAATLPKWVPGPGRAFFRRTSSRVLRRIFRPSYDFFEHTNPFMGVAFEYALSRVSERYRGVVDAPE